MSSRRYLCDAQISQAMQIADLSEFEVPVHAVGLIAQCVLGGLEAQGWPAPRVIRGPRIVTAEQNYALLGYAPDEVTLGSDHTRWISESQLLRTQTTSLIPPALVEAARARKPGETMLLAAPGITFRRDTRDRLHCAQPHQMDIWVMGDPPLSCRESLLKLVGDVLKAALPDHAWTCQDSPHHYTEGGIEINVVSAQQSVEVLECGCIARSLLERLGLDPLQHGGLAMGMGLDRLAMLRKGIPDIRLLRDPLPRIQAQMNSLDPWVPVSRLPSVTRDISLAVTPGQSEEELTESMLQAAGVRSGWIEEMRLLGRWSHGQLPPQALDRLGMLEGQENVLLRIVLRDCARSITAQEANQLYNDIQHAMHEGKAGGGYRNG
ncbi:hypothetical protein ACMGT0_07130 [Pseudomonas sp. RHF3.3-3]|uniref:PheS-related mystery ligase SrmL n=1 Tax=Pseudomonas sp. RHF3.3-3 TaxID=3396624 RepID=UPI003A87380F